MKLSFELRPVKLHQVGPPDYESGSSNQTVSPIPVRAPSATPTEPSQCRDMCPYSANDLRSTRLRSTGNRKSFVKFVRKIFSQWIPSTLLFSFFNGHFRREALVCPFPLQRTRHLARVHELDSQTFRLALYFLLIALRQKRQLPVQPALSCIINI